MGDSLVFLCESFCSLVVTTLLPAPNFGDLVSSGLHLAQGGMNALCKLQVAFFSSLHSLKSHSFAGFQNGNILSGDHV